MDAPRERDELPEEPPEGVVCPEPRPPVAFGDGVGWLDEGRS
ncbi:MAG: hypothetical protein OXH86_15895 [Acidimicrobiaceae bacterium]|nr:hypothetical protein [Acidimicrobiaceae bacterium]